MKYIFKNDNFKQIIVVFTLHIIGVFAFINVYPIQSISPELMKYFNATAVQIGLAVGAAILSISITSPLIGIISDRFGRKNIIIISMFLMIITTFLLSFAKSIHQIIILRFLQGIPIPGIAVVTIAYIGEEFTSKIMVKNMSFYITGTVLGGFLGRFIMGHISHLTNWHNAFLFMAMLNLIGTIFVWIFLPNSKNFKPTDNYKSYYNIIKSHLANNYLISSCVLGFCILFSLVSCFTFINIHLSQEPYNLTSANLSNIFIVYLFGLISTPLSIKLIIKFGIVKIIYFSILLSIFGLLLTLSNNLPVLIIGLTIMACGVFITQYSTVSYISKNITYGRSLASGLYYFMYYLGGTIGSWICGYAYILGNWNLTVLFIITIQIIALIITFFLIKD